MKKDKKLLIYISFFCLATTGFFVACTKYQNGFISPTMQYSVSTFNVIKGRIASSPTLVPDGSSIPLNIKWTHIYDSDGTIVDDLFLKEYPVDIWTAGYNPRTDTTFALITAKRGKSELPPIVMNPLNGSLEANSGTFFLPAGTYTMDVEVSNTAGVQELKKAMTIILAEGKRLETSPEVGAFSNGRLIANTAAGAPNGGYFNGPNNPYDSVVITRFADSPNSLILVMRDKNGVPFNPSKGEVAKRPNSGSDPIPPFLQNLQDYAPDTYVANDTAISIKFPLVPFPIASLGNGYNMYYRIPTAFVHMDSTSSWLSNPDPDNYYQGVNDSHYLGSYKDNLYDYSIRVPLRVQYPGSYLIDIKIMNTTHR